MKIVGRKIETTETNDQKYQGALNKKSSPPFDHLQILFIC